MMKPEDYDRERFVEKNKQMVVEYNKRLDERIEKAREEKFNNSDLDMPEPKPKQ